jgi:hypothetical protein
LTKKALAPVAVVLDLVQPVFAGRRLVYQARELRLDPFGGRDVVPATESGTHLANQGIAAHPRLQLKNSRTINAAMEMEIELSRSGTDPPYRPTPQIKRTGRSTHATSSALATQ